jgi:anti-sigma-K factor RskA
MTDTTTPTPQRANLWRAATIVCLLLMAVATATGMSMFEQFKAQVQHLQTKLQGTSQVKYIAVLLDSQQAPAMLLTMDPQDGALQIQRLNKVAEGREDTMQLWAVPDNGAPRSLGILESAGKTLRLAVDEKKLIDVPRLAISVENKGGVGQGASPRLPYLFSGALVQKAL